MLLLHLLLQGAAHGWTGAVLADTTGASPQAVLAALTITNIDDVRGHLHLPTEAGGHAIAWSSSDPGVIAPDGRVARPAAGDAAVTLTATVGGHARAFPAAVRRAAAAGALAFEGYGFAYFTGSTLQGENVFLAASAGNNALQWAELNGGQPVLRSVHGTRGLRDPFVLRAVEGDRFFLLATDLSIGSGTNFGEALRSGSRFIEVWESADLVTWSPQRHVEVSPPTAGNTWAPEAFYDAARGEYVVFWASSLYDANDTEHEGASYNRMMIATTRDFVTFSKPTVWLDSKVAGRIDADVIHENGVFYRFSKDEGAKANGCSDIVMESSTNLTATLDQWKVLATCIGRDAGTHAVEGPTSFKANAGDVNGNKFYLFLDEYGGRGYIPLETADIANPKWTMSTNFKLPETPRHGTVFPLTAAELAKLKTAYQNSSKSTGAESTASCTGDAQRMCSTPIPSSTPHTTTSQKSDAGGRPVIVGAWVAVYALVFGFLFA